MKPKAIIFGTTRTFCDPTIYIWQGHKQILKKFGANLTDEEIEKMKGQALQEQIEKINKKFNTNILYEEFSKQTKEISKELIKNNLKSFPGIKEIFDELKSKNIKIILASQNLKSNLSFYLKEINLEDYFDDMTTIEELTKFKPHPQLLELTLKKINEIPENCIYVDIKESNLIPAKNLNMQTILFKNPKQLNEKLNELLK